MTATVTVAEQLAVQDIFLFVEVNCDMHFLVEYSIS